MAFINWDETFSVRVEQFDNQHKKLVDLINELFETLSQGTAKDKISDIIGELVEYTKIHFRSEEAYFQKLGYPESTEHKAEHDDFEEEILSFQEAFETGSLTLSRDVMFFLKNWLMRHILGTDQKYSDFFNANGIK
jgi:hemerythrin